MENLPLSLRNVSTTHGFVDDGQNYCLSSDNTLIKVLDKSFYQRTVPNIIILTFQIMFLIQTLYLAKSLKKISKFQTIPFLCLQIAGFLLNLVFFFKWYGIPIYMTRAVFNTSFCRFMAYSEKTLPFVFHGLTLSILTMRLYRIFKGTASGWSKQTRFIFLSVINGIFFTIAILWFAYLSTPCVRVWLPYDYKTTDFLFYCNSYYSRNVVSAISGYVGIGFVVITNLIMGLYVTFKLKNIYDDFKLRSTLNSYKISKNCQRIHGEIFHSIDKRVFFLTHSSNFLKFYMNPM